MQLALPVDGRSATALDAVMDDVRDRFGATAVTRAVLLGRGPRLATWLFPDEED
jgi:DNA polymerase-4